MAGGSVDQRGFSYDCVGATDPASSTWSRQPAGFRAFERTVKIGRGDAAWSTATADVLAWAVKRRSGFVVTRGDGDGSHVVEGHSYWLSAQLGPLAVREPARVVCVVDAPGRVGFSYGTLDGHPVSGEEAFIVHQSGDAVFLTLRSLTRSGRGKWRLAYPGALVAQRCYRRRYLRALISL